MSSVDELKGYMTELAQAISTLQHLPTAAKELARMQTTPEYGFAESEMYGFEPEANRVSFAADADQYSDVSVPPYGNGASVQREPRASNMSDLSDSQHEMVAVSPLPADGQWGFDFE